MMTPTGAGRTVRFADFPTLTAALDFAATGETGVNLYSLRGELVEALPYARLREQAIDLAQRLLAAGAKPGDSVGLIAETDADFVRALWAACPPLPLDAEVPLFFIYTSGSTGKPKGVVYKHGARYAGEQLLKATLPFVPLRGERLLLMTPFVHGASLLTYAWCDAGGEVVLLDGVEIERIRSLLMADSLAAIFAPPTVLAKLTAALEGMKFPGVRCIFTGTQPLGATIYGKACDVFGPIVRVTYGKSECVNPITVLDPESTHAYFSSEDCRRAGACVGWPAPGVELRITAPEPAAGDHAQADGEIMVRAPQMSSGLLSIQGFIAHDEEGWHATGDLGYFDPQGRLMLTGRIADVIKTGGYRVNPDEIEALVTGLGLCGQVCVTSVPSDYWGEVIVAVSEQAREGWTLQAQERVSVLSRHKHPRLYVELPELPRNPQGKVSRRQVSAAILHRFVLKDGPYPTLMALP